MQQGGKKSLLFIIFGILAVVGSMLFCILRSPAKEEKAEEKEKLNPSNRNTVMSNEEPEEEIKSPIQDIKDTAKLLTDGKMIHLMPIIIWSAISLSCYAAIFIPLMTRSMSDSLDQNPSLNTKDARSQQALLTICMIGVGEMIGGVGVIGPIRDKFGNKVALIVLMVLTAAGLGIFYYYNQKDEYNWVAFLMCLIWGIQDAGVNCIINCILGFEFKSKSTPFSVYKFAQSLFIFAFVQLSGVVMDSKATSSQT